MISQIINLLSPRRAVNGQGNPPGNRDCSQLPVFHQVSSECSRITTEKYSTSFSSSIRLLHKDLQEPVYNIYGFVRFADEIVDTFHDYDKPRLFARFKAETYEAISAGISINPILHSFQRTVNRYSIDHELIEAFFLSMEMDLNRQAYDRQGYNEYIYGSAESVGLMCLHVFCEGNDDLFKSLRSPAQSLGAAFQKINFLRDVNADFNGLSRTYFPGVDFNRFTDDSKSLIEKEIEDDLARAFQGIRNLPWKARFGVYVAYKYYYTLFRKIKTVHASQILQKRVRIPDYAKAMILVRARVRNELNLIK